MSKKILLRRPDDIPTPILNRTASGESCTKRLSSGRCLTIDINSGSPKQEESSSSKQSRQKKLSLSVNSEDSLHWTKRSFEKHRKSLTKMTKLIKQSRVTGTESPQETTNASCEAQEPLLSGKTAEESESTTPLELTTKYSPRGQTIDTDPIVRRKSKNSKEWVSLPEEHGDAPSEGNTPPSIPIIDDDHHTSELMQGVSSCPISSGTREVCTGSAGGQTLEEPVPSTPTTANVVIQIEPITDISEDHKIIELEDLETNEKINLLICSKQHSSLEVGDKKPLEKKQRSLDLHSNSEFAVVHPTNLSHSDSSILRRGSDGSALKLIASGSYEKVITQLYIPMEERC